MESNAAASQGRQINILTTDVAPPHAVYLTADDSLELAIMCQVGIAMTLTARILLADGSISANSWPVRPISGGIIQLFSFPIGEGFLLGVTLQGVGQQIRRGQVFAWLSLVRGAPSFLNFSQSLAYGYVTTQSAVYWPDMTTEASFSGHGNIRSITGTTPAAGADISETVPLGVVWRLISFRFQFVTSATVGVRAVVPLIDDGTNEVWGSPPQQAIPASSTFIFSISDSSPFASIGNRIIQNLPSQIFMPPGYRFRTSTSGIQAADQLSGVQYLVEEWQQT